MPFKKARFEREERKDVPGAGPRKGGAEVQREGLQKELIQQKVERRINSGSKEERSMSLQKLVTSNDSDFDWKEAWHPSGPGVCKAL